MDDAFEIEATGACLLGGGSPCAQVINVIANGPTNASGFTQITVIKAGATSLAAAWAARCPD